MVSEALATALRAGREEMNARFVAARHAQPSLDAQGFLDFVARTIDPLAGAVPEVDRVFEVVSVAYEIGLELYAEKLVGADAPGLAIEECWRRVGVSAAKALSTTPRRLLTALANAAHQLSITEGASVEDWITTMEHAAGETSDLDTLLRVGQVAAWRAGLAHYRTGALALLPTLSERLSRIALAVPLEAKWPDVASALAIDRWSLANGTRCTQPFTVGAYRGFGGLFSQPPLVASAGEEFLVRSGEECWLLVADAFGATFHRATRPEFDAAPADAVPSPKIAIKANLLSGVSGAIAVDLPGGLASKAVTAHAIALTSPFSHAVTLVPRS
ncbi:MAG: hypothetical protein U0527_03565 [Candidatus Eisenbacteria bacterium]